VVNLKTVSIRFYHVLILKHRLTFDLIIISLFNSLFLLCPAVPFVATVALFRTRKYSLCYPLSSSYQCDCEATGFVGDHCEEDIPECASDPCQHGATCLEGINRYQCLCWPGTPPTAPFFSHHSSLLKAL